MSWEQMERKELPAPLREV
jgi:hypothetical protein